MCGPESLYGRRTAATPANSTATVGRHHLYRMFRHTGCYALSYRIICHIQVEAMLGKFSLDTIMKQGGMTAGFFLMMYLFTMIVMIMNFFVAILNDFLTAVANSKELLSRDYEVMDHFIETMKELIVTRTDNHGLIISHAYDVAVMYHCTSFICIVYLLPCSAVGLTFVCCMAELRV